MPEEDNRHAPDYDLNLRELLHSDPSRPFSLDEISEYISSNIVGNFDRHYLRTRLFKHGNVGRFSNPIVNHYQIPTPNPTRVLDVQNSWSEFIQNAHIFLENRTIITDLVNIKWRIHQIRDDGSNDYVELISIDSGTITKVKFVHFSNAITQINACGGVMERPDRRHSHRAAFCTLSNQIEFDERGYTRVIVSELGDSSGEEVSAEHPSISVGGSRRDEGEWNIRRKRAVHESDFEPQTIDSKHRIELTRERLERHEDLVDFVWFDWLGDEFDKKEGEYDLYSRNTSYPRILWEMKTIQLGDQADEKRQVRKAISQLLYYDFKLGDTGIHPLVACFEYEISPFLQSFLSSCGIHCCWKSGSRLIFSNQLEPPTCLLDR